MLVQIRKIVIRIADRRKKKEKEAQGIVPLAVKAVFHQSES